MVTIKNLVGLDLGSSSIKLIRLKKIKNKIELEKAKVIELKDLKSLPQAVATLLRSERIGSCKVAISVSGQSVFTRFVKLPKISKKKVEQVVKYEAQQQIPFPIDKVVWDYQLFEDAKTPEIEVFLAAIKRDIIDNLLQQLSQVKGIDIVSIQATPIALYNILKFNGEVKDNSIILDFGAKITNVVIAKGRQVWIRSIPIGGEDLTRSISEKLNLNLEQAETLKRKESITLVGATGDENLTPRSDAISRAINPVLTDILSEISRSISYYKSQFDKSAVFQKVLLTGGTSKIKYIERFFEYNLKIKTEKVNLLKKITPNKYLKANLDEIDDRLGIALGLGLAAVYSPTININLISSEQKKLKEFNRKKVYIYASEAIIILMFLMLSGFCLQSINTSKRNLSLIKEEMKKYRGNQRQIGKLQTDVDSVTMKLDLLNKIIDSKRFWLDILAEISSIIPKEAWLTKLTSDIGEDNIVIIEGKTTGSFDTVKNLKEDLMKLEYFSNVETLRADPPIPEDEEEIQDEYNVIFTLRLELNNKAPLYLKKKGTIEE